MWKSTVVAAAAALFMGLVAPTATAAPDRAELRQAMDELLATGAVGVQVRVHDSRGDWLGAAGKRELGGRDGVPVNGRFRAGSITKTFVSTVVLQLVSEGKVGLDDPVDRYLPQFGLDKRITVRMLLQHTSGLFSYTGEFKSDGTIEPGIPAQGRDFVETRFRTYLKEDLVKLSLSKPARFAPGASWSYSNTNYALAGLLIEKLTGTGYATQVERRILRPLGLRDTWLPGTDPYIRGPHAHGYVGYQDGGALRAADVTRQNASAANAAGEIISTTADLDKFITALLGGKLLAPAQLAEMTKTMPTRYLPAGLGLFQLGSRCGIKVFGHVGGIQGYTSYMFSTADGAKRYVFSVNSGPNASYAEALAKVADAAVCGKAE